MIEDEITTDQVCEVLATFVGRDRLIGTGPETPLIGHFPELDSMALTELVVALEDRFNVRIDDAQLTEENFATIGALTHLVASGRPDA